MKYFEAHHVTDFKDAEGNVPEILLVDGNRSGGKTTSFSRLLVNDFLEHGWKFMLILRYKNDLANVSEAFFKDIRSLFFEGHEMKSKPFANGAYMELYLDSKPCGYATALSMAGKIKRYSHVFSDVHHMFFDEYQDENNIYLPDEVQKLQSIHTTVARGQGQAVRFVPLYMCSNSISIFNPYYLALGITSKINSRTKVYRGTGFVLLRLVLKDIANAQKQSSFNRAFSGSGYLSSSIDNTFLNDDTFNVEKRKVTGSATFIFICSGKLYSAHYSQDGWYIRKGGDGNVTPCFGVMETDRGDGVTAIRNSFYLSRLRYDYEDALIFYDSQETKKAFMSLLFV